MSQLSELVVRKQELKTELRALENDIVIAIRDQAEHLSRSDLFDLATYALSSLAGAGLDRRAIWGNEPAWKVIERITS